MRQEKTDWIEYIADKVFECYKNRKIVLWGGECVVSKDIEDKLKEKYQVQTAFYVDNDTGKIDNTQVFSPDCLIGKSEEYYIVIPLAVHQSIKELLYIGGYKADIDYYYFNDCILYQEEDYYEDAHGNKIIGRYQGLKFTFRGFDSIIEIGDEVKFQGTVLHISSDAKCVIESSVKLQGTSIDIDKGSFVLFGKDVSISGSKFYIGDSARCEIKSGCCIGHFAMCMKNSAQVLLHENIRISDDISHMARWHISEFSVLEIGCGGEMRGGCVFFGENAVLRIGYNFTISLDYVIRVEDNTTMLIGNDCQFSDHVNLNSNDGHSIFDIVTGKNINSSPDIQKVRKIVIGNHVWIGAGARILYDTQIHDGSIVGAMSLVKGEVANNCIVAGVPAKVIRENIAWSREDGAENILECGKEYVKLTTGR